MYDKFQLVKDSVDIIQVAEYYGISVNRSKKAICPFHDDHEPSLSFKKQRFKCFGCDEGGDVIDLVRLLMKAEKPIDAVRELNRSFNLGIDMDAPLSSEIIERATYARRLWRERKRQFEAWENGTVIILSAYCRFLRECRTKYAPRHPDDEFHPLFLESLHRLDYIEYVVEDVFIAGSKEERMAFVVDCAGMVREIEQRLIQERVPYANRDEAFYSRFAPFTPIVIAGVVCSPKAA